MYMYHRMLSPAYAIAAFVRTSLVADYTTFRSPFLSPPHFIRYGTFFATGSFITLLVATFHLSHACAPGTLHSLMVYHTQPQMPHYFF